MVRGAVFERIEVEWIDEAKREGVLDGLSIPVQNEYMDTLYQISKSTHINDPTQLRAG